MRHVSVRELDLAAFEEPGAGGQVVKRTVKDNRYPTAHGGTARGVRFGDAWTTTEPSVR
jgi:hypothetical protein